MEKIIVLTGGSKHDENLIACLKSLFPECEIEIQTRKPQIQNALGTADEIPDKGLMDKNLDKYMSFL